MSAVRKRVPKRPMSANNTNLRFPDSPEGVALALAYLIDQSEPAPNLIALYRKCLAVVSGAEDSYGGVDSLDRVLH
jgi:hypothetical protein